MKKLLLLIATSFIYFSTVSQLTAQNTYVPDDNFEQALIDLGYDEGPLNDSVPTANISSITFLDINTLLSGKPDLV